MEELILLHNPSAGEEDHDKEMLVQNIQNAGFKCAYVSLKEKKWKNFKNKSDILVIAGGDGSIRKVAKYLLSRSLLDKRFAIAVLPMGTANNIAKSLQASTDWLDLMANWQKNKIKGIDIGSVYNLAGSKFFLEGMGYGLIPKLMKKMETQKEIVFESTEQELQFALQMLLDIIENAKARYCTIIVDDHQLLKGSYLMVEVMNLPFIGPNLNLAPSANPSDGKFNLVLLPENKREQFKTFIKAKLNGTSKRSPCQVILGAHFEIKWDGNLLHLDDELIEPKRTNKLRIEARRQVLHFLT